MAGRGFVIKAPTDSRTVMVRTPDGLTITASGWDEVWAACPEFGVPIDAVSFESDGAREAIAATWGHHPDMPVA